MARRYWWSVTGNYSKYPPGLDVTFDSVVWTTWQCCLTIDTLGQHRGEYTIGGDLNGTIFPLRYDSDGNRQDQSGGCHPLVYTESPGTTVTGIYHNASASCAQFSGSVPMDFRIDWSIKNIAPHRYARLMAYLYTSGGHGLVLFKKDVLLPESALCQLNNESGSYGCRNVANTGTTLNPFHRVGVLGTATLESACP